MYFQYKDVQKFLKEVSLEKILQFHASRGSCTVRLHVPTASRIACRAVNRRHRAVHFASICSPRELLCEFRNSFHLVHAYTILPKCLRASPSVSCEDTVPVVTCI